jgi:hypothetical protein
MLLIQKCLVINNESGKFHFFLHHFVHNFLGDHFATSAELNSALLIPLMNFFIGITLFEHFLETLKLYAHRMN